VLSVGAPVGFRLPDRVKPRVLLPAEERHGERVDG
jgi:hypothetical protein